MVRSLRWRLLLWYGLVLVIAVGAFAGILYTWHRTARFEQVDTRLTAGAEYLEAVVRSFPGWMLESNGRPPPMQRRPRPEDPMGKGRDRDREKDRERDRDRPPPMDDPEGMPPDFFDGRPPPRDGGRPPERGREQALGELNFPKGWVMPPEPMDRPYFAVWYADEKMLKSENWTGHPPPRVSELSRRPVMRTVGANREAMMIGPRQVRIVVGQPVQRELNESATFAWRLGLIALGVVVFSLIGGWIVASRLVRPIAAMSDTAEAINAQDMSKRIDTANIDAELAGLADSLNAAFDRLSGAFARQTQFTADASHELRTPLAIVRTNAELSLNKERTPEEYRATLTTCVDAAKRMSAIVDGLLTLARSDANVEVPRRPVQLDQIATDAVEALRAVAQSQSVTLDTKMQAMKVTGDADALGRLVTNLVGNAIKFNKPGGRVLVSVGPNKTGVELVVADNGIGIPKSDMDHVFERFYRADKARTRATGGAGLGLAICQAVVESHGGKIEVESQADKGTTFTVHLPKND